jgi:hypothetical protein
VAQVEMEEMVKEGSMTSICLYKNNELSGNKEISLRSSHRHKNSTNKHMKNIPPY